MNVAKSVTIQMHDACEKKCELKLFSASESVKMGARNTLKYASLVTLTVQNAALSLTMRMSRTQNAPGELFISSTAVIMSEVIKLLTCLAMVRIDEGSFHNLHYSLKKHIVNNPMDTLKVAVPSIVYYIQNNLIYIGATHLDAATCQVTYQLKILTTALLSVLMLRKKLFVHQWLALFVLFAGVAVVQIDQISTSRGGSNTSQSPLIGFSAIVAACCLSGFAGVYFEKILKSTSDVSLWIRNIQLSAMATPFGLLQLMLTDYSAVHEKGFFHGYTLLTWIVVLLQAQGGLLVAVVVKYADNILKGFATSLAIIVSCVISVYAFDVQINSSFVFGASLVIGSTLLYAKQVSPPK